jgi:CO/xanthine dehydrogenase Mo-binding subunit
MSQITEPPSPVGVVEKERVIGRRIVRYDANQKVSGTAIFGTDVFFPNLLHGKILHSAYPHAKILKLDTSKAEEYQGVKAVVTAQDIPDVHYGFAVKDQVCLPRDRVIYHGQPICAVAAETPEIAERALSEIEIDYEPLQNILTIDQALEDQSISIHPDVTPAGSPPHNSKNVCSFTRIHRGNVERAFKLADFILEETYSTQQVNQCYLEPRATTAEVDERSGRIKVWTSTQSPFLIRNSLSEILSVPVSQIQVIATHTGGGFGAKILSYLEPLCVALSRKARRPVRIVLTREEEFTAGTPRPSMRFWIKSGVKDGKMIARQGRAIVNTGAHGSEGAVYANIAALQLVGPYNISNVETEGISVYTNKQPAGAFRAPGTMETAFAVESHTDMLAKKANTDPFQFRLNNVWTEGSLGSTGQILRGVGLKDAMIRAAERIGWEKLRLSNKDNGAIKHGIGVACGLIPSVGIHSSAAYIKLNEDGKFVLVTGAQDTGSGALTGLAMIAAEELGVGIEDIIIQSGDTDFAPWDGGAQGSRTTFGAGSAVLMAARDAKEQILRVASTILKTDKSRISLKGGEAHSLDTNESVKYSSLAMTAHYVTGGPILGRGSFVQAFPEYDKNSIEGYTFVPSFHDPTFVAHVAVVEVNTQTGKVRIKRYAAAQDLGRCINPLGAEGQIQGGVAQGIGYALYEEMIHDEGGFTTNTNFGEYKIPTIMDVPLIEPIIVEGHYGSGPFGAKGVGEANIVPPAPAIANAIFDATGVRVRALPMTPERVLELDEKSIDEN